MGAIEDDFTVWKKGSCLISYLLFFCVLSLSSDLLFFQTFVFLLNNVYFLLHQIVCNIPTSQLQSYLLIHLIVT